jgi:deazaflavin-dependent oxidoreductase (nitroreductase family)
MSTPTTGFALVPVLTTSSSSAVVRGSVAQERPGVRHLRSRGAGAHGATAEDHDSGRLEDEGGTVPLSQKLARFNRRVTNRVSRHVAGWAPTFAIVHHVGRRSGREYETPVNAFPVGDRYAFALTYGRGEWVRNVVAAGGCTIRTRRRDVWLSEPEFVTDPSRRLAPIPFRWVLRLIGVDEFLVLRVRPTPPSPPA